MTTDQSARAGDGNSKAVEAAHLFRLIDDFLKPHGWAAQKLLRDYVELVKAALAAAPAASAPAADLVEARKLAHEMWPEAAYGSPTYGWIDVGVEARAANMLRALAAEVQSHRSRFQAPVTGDANG